VWCPPPPQIKNKETEEYNVLKIQLEGLIDDLGAQREEGGGGGCPASLAL